MTLQNIFSFDDENRTISAMLPNGNHIQGKSNVFYSLAQRLHEMRERKTKEETGIIETHTFNLKKGNFSIMVYLNGEYWFSILDTKTGTLDLENFLYAPNEYRYSLI